MKIAVVGGKLQGVEALYLAKKAGYETVLIDKNRNALGRFLCDHFIHHAFSEYSQEVSLGSHLIDAIIPACENIELLQIVENWARESNIFFACDLKSFQLSSSKKKSNALFSSIDLPQPLPWPEANFPLLVKPDNGSGSKGVKLIFSEDELQAHLSCTDKPIVQEFLYGPSYSVEITGSPGQYVSHQVTELHMDYEHDCKRVTCPSDLSRAEEKVLAGMALKIANSINLKGIMDLEVIYSGGEFKILEIDARLPSQTPMAVFNSSGVNLLRQLVERPNHAEETLTHQTLYTTLEHIHVRPGELNFIGETKMCQHGPLHHLGRFYGADEALTSFPNNSDDWVATLIFKASTRQELLEKRMNCFGQIRQQAISSSTVFVP